MAHAIHYLAFTAAERQLIDNLLRPVFGARAAVDEAFAVYSEREFIDDFGARNTRLRTFTVRSGANGPKITSSRVSCASSTFRTNRRRRAVFSLLKRTTAHSTIVP